VVRAEAPHIANDSWANNLPRPPLDRDYRPPLPPLSRSLRSRTFTAGLSPALSSASGVNSATWWQTAQSTFTKSPAKVFDPWLGERTLSGGYSRLVFCAALRENGDREMLHRTLAGQLFDALALQLTRRSAPRTSSSQSAEISGPPSDLPAPEPHVGTLLYLVSLGIVAITIVVIFFGLGLLLLTHPDRELIAGLGASHGDVEVQPRPSDLIPSPDQDAEPATGRTEVPHPATTSAPSVPPAAHQVLPSASRDTSTASTAANATFDASPSPEQPRLESNADEATLATPAWVIHPQINGIGRHRHARTRTHWAGANGPPPSISGPEKAWRWIVQSATSILAALSPPPSRQAPGLRTR
jgi:hypothetical protein